MDKEKIIEKLNSIIEIVEILPDRYREKAFEILFYDFLRSGVAPETGEETPSKGLPLPLTLRGFLQRHNITINELNSVVLKETDEAVFVAEPENKPISKAQISWALLLALKSALMTGEFKVDPEAVRSICQQKGCYDKANFAKTFKQKKNRGYFIGLMEKQGEARLLSSAGEEKLAQRIRELATN